MKKILSVILASLIITAAGCAGNEAAVTTTATAAETTTTAAETEAPPDDSFLTDEEKVFIGKLRTEVPIYADFYAANLKFPVTVTFYNNNFLFEGNFTKAAMEIGMATPSSSYVFIDPEATEANIISIFKDGMHYNIIPETQTAIYAEIKRETAHRMINAMTADLTPNFDPFAAEYETCESLLNGETYLRETIRTEEVGEIIVFADTKTKEIRHIISGGVMLEDINVSNTIDYGKLEIPTDYTLTDMAELIRVN